MKIFFKLSSYALAILGIVHVLCTSISYSAISCEAFWFAGTGLALLFLGVFNLTIIKSSNASVYTGAIFANGLCVLFSMLLLFVHPVWRSIAMLFVSLCVLLGSILRCSQLGEPAS